MCVLEFVCFVRVRGHVHVRVLVRVCGRVQGVRWWVCLCVRVRQSCACACVRVQWIIANRP